jgi:hypothetical protein
MKLDNSNGKIAYGEQCQNIPQNNPLSQLPLHKHTYTKELGKQKHVFVSMWLYLFYQIWGPRQYLKVPERL